MKRSDLRQSLQKIKKKIDTASDERCHYVATETSEMEKQVCTCKDGNGEVKTLYTNRKEAEDIASLTQEHLRVYPCPSENGWHLTSI